MINPREKFELTPQERDSALWKKLKEHYEGKLSVRRLQNDGDKDEIETSRLRGRIAEIKELLGLDAPAITTNDREAAGN